MLHYIFLLFLRKFIRETSGIQIQHCIMDMDVGVGVDEMEALVTYLRGQVIGAVTRLSSVTIRVGGCGDAESVYTYNIHSYWYERTI